MSSQEKSVSPIEYLGHQVESFSGVTNKNDNQKQHVQF